MYDATIGKVTYLAILVAGRCRGVRVAHYNALISSIAVFYGYISIIMTSATTKYKVVVAKSILSAFSSYKSTFSSCCSSFNDALVFSNRVISYFYARNLAESRVIGLLYSIYSLVLPIKFSINLDLASAAEISTQVQYIDLKIIV